MKRNTIKERRAKWIGRVLCHNSLLRDIIEDRISGKGRPRQKTLDWLIAKVNGKTYGQLMGALKYPQLTFVTKTLEPPKIKQCAFLTFPKYGWATKCYAYRWYTTFINSLGTLRTKKNPIWRCKTPKCASRLLSFVVQIISRVPGPMVTKFQRLYPCFRGRAFQHY